MFPPHPNPVAFLGAGETGASFYLRLSEKDIRRNFLIPVRVWGKGRTGPRKRDGTGQCFPALEGNEASYHGLDMAQEVGRLPGTSLKGTLPRVPGWLCRQSM